VLSKNTPIRVKTLQRESDFIFSPRWILYPKPIGLDGEEIETVCELKGLALRFVRGELFWYIAPDQRHSSRKGEKQFLIFENRR
jgi:hypothetical protein